MWQLDVPIEAEPLGYRFLVDYFQLDVIAHYRWSYSYSGWDFKEFKYEQNPVELHLYPKSYQIEKNALYHLEFALKHEGLNLLIIKQVFFKLGSLNVTNYIQASPTGKYARKIWFLYEYLLDEKLPLKDINRGSYVSLLDDKLYYCGGANKSSRHRIIDNQLGNAQFSPLVRRSARLMQFEEKKLRYVAEELTKKYDSEVLARAIRYLFTKETIASWEIEREKPDKARVSRFVSLLQQNYADNEFSKRFLLMIQRGIVDPRFALDDYRGFQNYVGEEPSLGEILVHYIAPKPLNLPVLMEGLIKCASTLFGSSLDPVVAAAVLSFGFVFMHPFWDGNGRLHRFLIHYTLSKMKFTPEGVVFPVSAVMLREHREYDKALEYFSRPLNEIIRHYQIDERGDMTITQETCDYYRYIDFTPMAEFLYRCVEQTIHTDLEQELHFLSRYDVIKSKIKNVVEMPDKEIDLLIRCVRQNKGTLSQRKRETWFSMLSNKEIEDIEAIINEDREM